MIEGPFFHKESTSSTMDDARDAVRSGHGHGTVCSADTQTAGRGRIAGRRWEDNGQSLVFTLVLDKRRISDTYPPTQMMALALCLYLESDHGLEPKIKWPNDVLLDGRKIAGILVETVKNYYLAGMGLNLHQSSFSTGFRRPAVSLATAIEENGRLETSAAPVASMELRRLLKKVGELIKHPLGIGEISRRLDSLGHDVSVSLGDPARDMVLKGCVEGLKYDGALLLRSIDGTLHPIYSGEIIENS